MKNPPIHYIAIVWLFAVATLSAQPTHWENSPSRTFEEALNLFDKKLYSPASAKFVTVMEVVPNKRGELFEKAMYYRALAHIYQMNEDGESLMEEFMDVFPASSRVKDGVLKTADYFFTRRRYIQVQTWLEKIDPRMLDFDEREDYYFKLGYSQFSRNDFELAKENFHRILGGTSHEALSAQYYYAHIAYLDSNFATALKYLEPLKETEAFGRVVPYYLAQIYYKTGDYTKLEAIGAELLENAVPNRAAEVARLVGEAYFNRNKYKEAQPFLEYYQEHGSGMKAEDHFQLGFVYYKNGEYAKAEERFNQITGLRNNMGQRAYYYLADCYLKSDKKNEAMSAFKAASEVGDDEKIKETALYNYAKLSYEIANPFESAIDAFVRFKKAFPKSQHLPEANRYLANLYLTTKNYQQALKALAETGLTTPDLKEAYQKIAYFRGVELFNSGRWQEAIGNFDESRKYPINQGFVARSHFWSAEAFFRLEKYREALAAYKEFQNTPGSFNMDEFSLSQYGKGYSYFMLQDYGTAATQFRLFLDGKKLDNRKKTDASLRLADAYFMVGNYAQASRFYRQFTNPSYTDGAYASFQNALCLGLLNQNNDKVNQLRSLITTYPRSKYAIDAQFELGNTYLKMEENQKALDAYNTFVNNFPNSVYTRRALLNKGVIYRNIEQYEKSIGILKDVVEKYPATPEANEAISFARLVYRDAGKIDDYVTWVEGISFADVKKASLDTTVYSAAFDQYSMGNCERALDDFDNYLRRFPEGYFLTEAYYYTADCALKTGNEALAVRRYKQVVARPRSSFTERSYARLAALSFKGENYTEAIEYYEQLISFSEEESRFREANTGLMRSHYRLNNLQRAIQFSEIVMNDEKSDAALKMEAQLIKARSLWKLQDINGAHQAFEQLRRSASGEPLAEALYHIAKIQNMKGDYADSRKTIFKLIDDLPSYPRWRYKALLVLADNYWKEDDPFQANYTLDFVIEDNFDPEITEQAKALKQDIQKSQMKTQNNEGDEE